tara:strand:- start:842 stop:1051 length:210 start_codon:yes stop_codon:yes gene_type:complete
MARTYFCDCGEKTEEIKNEPIICDCGYVFGSSFKTSNYVNMRNTMSGTTKMEFRETTMGDSMTDMGIKH